MDLHTREQSIAEHDTATGEMRQLCLRHDGDAVEQFYADLRRSWENWFGKLELLSRERTASRARRCSAWTTSGSKRFARRGPEELYDVMTERCEKASIALSSNRDRADWRNACGKPCAAGTCTVATSGAGRVHRK